MVEPNRVRGLIGRSYEAAHVCQSIESVSNPDCRPAPRCHRTNSGLRGGSVGGGGRPTTAGSAHLDGVRRRVTARHQSSLPESPGPLDNIPSPTRSEPDRCSVTSVPVPEVGRVIRRYQISWIGAEQIPLSAERCVRAVPDEGDCGWGIRSGSDSDDRFGLEQ